MSPTPGSIHRRPPADMLAHIGQALYGERWLRPLARDLQMDHTVLLRQSREGRIGREIFAAVLELLSQRELEITDAAGKLERWLAKARTAA